VASLLFGSVDVEAAAPDGGCAFRRRLRDPWRGAVQMLTCLGRQSCVASAVRLSARSTGLTGGGLTFRPGRRPRMLAWRPWSASVYSMQLGLWVAESFGVVAHVRAVVCRDGGPGRLCWVVRSA
jgi:hypothetical protein